VTWPRGIEAAAEGAEIIVHCAGSGKGDEDKAVNLVRAASRAGTRHLVPALSDSWSKRETAPEGGFPIPEV
jgi:uncharacterized protein YbjT (DUF2867 family)